MGCGSSKNQTTLVSNLASQQRLSLVTTNQRGPLPSSSNQPEHIVAPVANQEQTVVSDDTVSELQTDTKQTGTMNAESALGEMLMMEDDVKVERKISTPPKESETVVVEKPAEKPTLTQEVKPLTPEEATEKAAATINVVKKTIDKITNNLNFTESDETFKQFRMNLFVLGKAYFALKGGNNADVINLRGEIGMLLYENNIVRYLCDFIIHEYTEVNYKDNDGKIISPNYMVLKSIHIILLNYSDACEQCAVGMCEHGSFLKVMADKLREWRQPHMDSTILEEENKMLKWDLGIIHNVAMVDSSISLLRSLDYTHVLLPYMNSSQDMFRLSTILALSDVVEESDCELLQTNGQGIQFLLQILQKALNSPTRKNLGFSSKELGRAVGRVARSDANKKSLVNEGALPLLVDMAKTATDTAEERDAFNSIWMLAFDDDNKAKIMAEPELIDFIVKKVQESPDDKARKSCQGILWTLRNQLTESNKYRDIGLKFSRKPDKAIEEKSGQKLGHVMVSYQWANQEILKKIRDSLRQAVYPVWMDIDNMGGSTLQAMAEAIEDAKVVLICMSHKYRNSPNCRAEAEYAFQKRKTIIPLIMERGYHPDGWLGMILGSKLFYDFSGKYKFEDKFDGLVKELDRRYNKQPSPSGGGDFVDSPISQPIVATRADVYHSEKRGQGSSDKVKSWNEADVKQWLQKHDLSELSKLQKLSGREISFLSKLRFEAPEYFYKTVETKLGVESLLDLVKFIEAMDALSAA